MHREWGAMATRHHKATIEDVRKEAKRQRTDLPNSLRELRRMWGACE